MNQPVITCPKCKSEIKLTESLAAPLLLATKREYEKKLAEKDNDVANREAEIDKERKQLAKAKETFEDQLAARLKTERERIAAEENKKARRLMENDLQQQSQALSDAQELLKDREEKLAAAQKLQADTLRKQRELDDAKRALELTIEERVQGALTEARSAAKQEAEEGLKLQLKEREVQIGSMQRQIEELRRKAEQGSQQLQGESFEIELEDRLSSRFPTDLIEPVPKGEFGGDLLQRVVGPAGQHCGTMLWEFKRTKNWNDSWLAKLREDKRAARADLALIVSRALPKGIENFDLIDGVWVVDTRCAIPVAIALRQSLIELSAARKASDGQQTKMELVYSYMTGPRFRHRIEAVVEKISAMQTDLDKERNAMTRLWSKREEQIRGIIELTVGMYGDLQGIAGRSLQEIEGLELPRLASPDADFLIEPGYRASSRRPWRECQALR